MQESASTRGTTAHVLHHIDSALSPCQDNTNRLNENRQSTVSVQTVPSLDSLSISELQNEFNLALKKQMKGKLSEVENLYLEEDKLALMKAMYRQLQKHTHTPLIKFEKPPKQKVAFRSIAFVTLLLLEFVPMISGSYLGITGLMSNLPWLSQTLIAGASLLVCGIEAILYYAVKGPLLKKALGIFKSKTEETCLDVYEKQLQVLKNIDKALLLDKKMAAQEYQHYLKLARQFSTHIYHLKTYALYLKTNFEDPEIKAIEEKALIVVGNQVRVLNQGQFVKNSEGGELNLTLNLEDKDKLAACPCEEENGKVLRTLDKLQFLDQLIHKLTATLPHSSTIRPFQESLFKKGLRWFLSAVDMSLNIGGGYFLATSLLAGTAATAALLGTPIGWGLITLIIIGQFALRLAVGSNAMFHLLNPAAEKHRKVTEEINAYELNTQKYAKNLKEKKLFEKMHTTLKQQALSQKAQNNPYVDSYKISYLNNGQFHEKRVPQAQLARQNESLSFQPAIALKL